MSSDSHWLDIITEKVEEELYPQIVLAAQKALDAYEQDTENFGNYTLGCAFWENVTNRMLAVCRKSTFFKATFYKNVLEISAVINGKRICFYVPRVDEETRMPCTGKHIKSILQQEQYFLSQELREIMGKNGVYSLGCDLDSARGFGSVTFDQLIPMGKKNYEAVTLARFGKDIVQTPPVVLQEERAKKPTVRKEATRQRGLRKAQ